jgi:hypothetical protein
MSRNWSRLRRFISAKQSRFPSGITAFLGQKVRIQPIGQVLPNLMYTARSYPQGLARLLEGREPDETFALVTTEPNEFVAQIHDRPVLILHPRDYDR